MDTGTDKVIVEVDGQLGWITFNNPARHNALSLEVWAGLGAALEACQNDPDVRVVIMRGAGGKAFISGADITEFSDKRNSVAQKAEYSKVSDHAQRWLIDLDKPLLAMIQGFCIGGGLAVALGADIRFATPGSIFGIPAAKLGLGYDFAGIATLSRLVGPSTARDILYSARFLKADEAYEKRLINFIVADDDLQQQVTDYAQRIAANAPMTIRAAKAAVDAFELDPDKRDLQRISELVDACYESADYQEGQKAFLEKRKPDFHGR